MERISISAFFPAYNDEHTIEGIVRTAAAEIQKVTDEFEVIVVNDGSKDRTAPLLDSLAAELPYLRVIHHVRNLGYGAALITGFQNATKDLIFYTDGDGQYDVREIHRLLAAFGPNVDLVNGYKIKRADAWYRVWIGAFYRRSMRTVFRLSIRDVDCDFRLFRRYILETVTLESKSGVICVEIAKKFERAGFRMAEVPVSHYRRMHGSSEFFRVRHLVHTFRGLIKIWWNLTISHRLPDTRRRFRPVLWRGVPPTVKSARPLARQRFVGVWKMLHDTYHRENAVLLNNRKTPERAFSELRKSQRQREI